MRTLKNGLASEDMIHKAVMDWVRARKIEKFVIHIPNEGERSPSFGNKLKNLGMRAGVSDLFICMPRHSYHGAWIEIKSESGKATPQQLQFQADMVGQKYYTKVTYGLDETIEELEWYCFWPQTSEESCNGNTFLHENQTKFSRLQGVTL